MSKEKLRVALICHVSNRDIRGQLNLKKISLYKIAKFLRGKSTQYQDYSVWNTLFIKEMEKIDDIELHPIIPHLDMLHEREDFELNGIFYHCFRLNLETISNLLGIRKKPIFEQYHHNTKCIVNIVKEINPDMVVMIGAEGPFFNLSGLQIDTERIPFVLVMQTAMSDPDFKKYYPISEESYRNRTLCEQALFKHFKYIATDSKWFRYIASQYNKDAIFVRFHLCTPTYNIKTNGNKIYDFAYWAANINKAGDDAIEAFALAHEKNPKLTLNMVGKYTEEYMHRLTNRMRELGIETNVHFTGFLPTHHDALKEVAKSRFALVPIKIDVISSTIREAMILGMPVVTFKTKGTPYLNDNYETVLLSDIGDYKSMAENMLRVSSDNTLAKKLIENSKRYVSEFLENTRGARVNVDVFHSVYEHFHHSTPIPDDLTKTIY